MSATATDLAGMGISVIPYKGHVLRRIGARSANLWIVTDGSDDSIAYLSGKLRECMAAVDEVVEGLE